MVVPSLNLKCFVYSSRFSSISYKMPGVAVSVASCVASAVVSPLLSVAASSVVSCVFSIPVTSAPVDAYATKFSCKQMHVISSAAISVFSERLMVLFLILFMCSLAFFCFVYLVSLLPTGSSCL